ncbi:hypothetical protein CAEBREN_03427 [Caenorhabditis brenneri]|uniref:Uncharacterized protein n=1 Tax=Caenorhabditis brenneri TaxID=135651 RepID=G0MA74_CAEBE|nr:hypothetical protein CAEBREN_03427 [Caenorhabditis brenneri]
MNTLYIDPDMTLLFNFCTRQQDYNEFYDTYKRDIEICAQRLEHLEIPKNTLCHFITQNVAKLFTILTANSSCDHRKLAAGCCGVELQQPEFIDDLKKAVEKKDWQPFYDKYRKYADTIIKEARRQRFLNVLIEWRSEPYLNLESRDKAILAQSNDTMRISVNRASSSVENRSGMRLLPYEPEDGGNNETEISPGGPGSSSALEEFGEIGVIASETPEESAMELPGRIDQEQFQSPEIECKPKIINSMMEDFDNYERKMKYKELCGFESTSRNPPLEKEIPEKSPQETKLQENEFEEYEKEMSKLLNDVLKQHPTEEKNGVEESSKEHPPETILDMVTDFIEKMWEG